MSESPISDARRDEALGDIRRYITHPEEQRQALKQFHALLEYSPEDESVCTWEAALDYCEQVKGYFPPTTPEPALENIEAIAASIRRNKARGTSTAWSFFWNPKLLLALAGLLALVWALSHFVPRGW